jgi:hypothetical protein
MLRRDVDLGREPGKALARGVLAEPREQTLAATG